MKYRIILVAFILLSCFGCEKPNKPQPRTPVPIPVRPILKPKPVPKNTNVQPQVKRLAGVSIIKKFGSEIDKHDKEYIIRSSQDALNKAQVGETLQWRNPESGNHGSLTITSEASKVNDHPCRNFSQTATIQHKQMQISGKACLESGHSWLTH